MRIALDLDGTICEGKYLVQPERAHETYMELKPYDENAIRWLGYLCITDECYIITSRSYTGARWSIKQWLNKYEIDPGLLAGIITNIEQVDKYHLATCMGCDIIVDDSPVVWRCSRTCGDGPEMILMDNPEWEANQACNDTPYKPGTYKRCYSWKELGERIDRIATTKLHTS